MPQKIHKIDQLQWVEETMTLKNKNQVREREYI
jgi:hypothetical protein